MQEPVRSLLPVKCATGPPVASVRAETTLVTVESVCVVTELRVVGEEPPPPVWAAVVMLARLPVVERGEHPKKSGIVTL